MLNNLKEGLQSVLRICSAHNKGGLPCKYKHCANFVFFELFLNQDSGLYSFTSIANHSSVKYSVSKLYFTNMEFENVNKQFENVTLRTVTPL